MTIAINAKHLLKNTKEGYGNFIYECFKRIVNLHPQHTFIFIFDKPFDASFVFSSNVIPVVIGPQPKNLLLLKLWYNFKIPVALKKYKADLFISAEACSLRSKIPQLLIINDVKFLNHSLLASKRYAEYIKKHTSKFFNKAKVITAFSDSCRNNILGNYKIDEDKIDVVYQGIDENFKPIDFSGREEIKGQYSQSNEYFLFFGNLNQEKSLFNILKAFSGFKKWQKSGMHLLIVTGSALNPKELKSLQSFKYNKDVKIIDHSVHQLPNVVASAYAVVDLSYPESFGVHTLEAMKCNVPVITGDEGAMPEICAGAALYVNPGDHKIIAEKMMMIFKDEKLRRELIKKGEEQVKKYGWEKTAGLFWESILKATH